MAERIYHMALDLTMSIINGKWKSLILCHLGGKSARNGELMREMPDISQKVLTQQLNEMIKDGIVQRVRYPGLPLHVEYSLTEEGRSLRKVLLDMSVWGEQHATKMAEKGQRVSFCSDNFNGYKRIDDTKRDVNQQIAE